MLLPAKRKRGSELRVVGEYQVAGIKYQDASIRKSVASYV